MRKHTFKDDQITQQEQLSGTNKLRQERDRSLLINIILVIAVVCLGGAIIVLSKLQTVIPVIAMIDANGHVVNEQVVDKYKVEEQDSFVQSQVYDFIAACNTFDPDWRQHFSDMCHVRSIPEVAKQYDVEISPDNAANPYYVIGKNGKRYPKITSITSVGDHTFRVAFRSITEKDSGELKTEYFTALIHYVFTNQPLAVENRWENPLGFAVTSYHKDQELAELQPNHN